MGKDGERSKCLYKISGQRKNLLETWNVQQACFLKAVPIPQKGVGWGQNREEGWWREKKQFPAK